MSQPTITNRRSFAPFHPAALALSLGIVASALLGLGFLLWSAGGGFGGGILSRTIVPGVGAPDFSLPTTDSRTMHLADYKGRAVFLAFVPSWDDARTLQEVRSLRAAENQYDMAGAKLLLIGPAANREAAATLHDAEKLPFPTLLDGNGELAKRYGVPTGYRTTFVVTPAGLVKYRISDAAVDAPHHGQQILDVSKCCIDELTAAKAHGVGKPVGDYSLPLAHAPSQMATIFGDGKQRATAVVFISTKCPCANAYNDRIKDWAAAYAAKGVRFIAVYANKDESAADIAAHAASHGFTFPILRDDHALCADHFGAAVTPECFVMDAGRILRYAGRLDDSRDPAEVHTHDLAGALDAVLMPGHPLPAESRAFGCAIVR